MCYEFFSCCAAAFVTHTKPREISFTGTWNRVSAGWLLRSRKSCVSDKVIRQTLTDIASYRVGNRPGRLEPRVVRKRPKPFTKRISPKNTNDNNRIGILLKTSTRKKG
ncbi:MAG: hypothetical protein LBC20_02065 [Planctomycetaceae bacterium]|nr:hypothetical protein [Planctomycetaceae bacterium]